MRHFLLVMKSLNEKKITKLNKLFADAFILHEKNQVDEAQCLYRKVLELDNTHVNALHMLGAIYLERGAVKEAAALIKKSLAVFPQQADAWCNFGLCMEKQEDMDGALAAYGKALQLRPNFPGALYNMAALLRKQLNFEAALFNIEKAITLQPGFVEAINNKGNVLTDMGRIEDAIASFTIAISLNPAYAETYNNRGVCFWKLKRFVDAIADYDQALYIKPNYFSATLNRATALYDTGHYELADDAVKKALFIQPDDIEAWALQYNISARSCDWEGYTDQVSAISSAVSHNELLPPFTVLTAIDNAAIQYKAAKRWAASFEFSHSPVMILQAASLKTRNDKRLRIAYLSADFQEHAVAYSMARVFECHDKSRFECHAISLGTSQLSPMRQRIVNAFEHFVDASLWSDGAIIEYIRQQHIDILIDLAGYTQGSRTAVLARKPAAVQINYLGYPGTSGLSTIDYIVADKTVIPERLFPFFSEKVIHLADSFFCNDPTRVIDTYFPSRAELNLPEKAFVFCCFNHHYKITPPWFELWMRLLGSIDNSVLWLAATNDLAQKHLQQKAVACGVDASRLVFAVRTPEPSQHLSRMRQADLFLDTLPYNAHATASDALWAGIPLLTCVGESFPARVAASLLMAIGLPELITHSPEAYEARALELAMRPEQLLVIRNKLAIQKVNASLFDAASSARKLECAYSAVWERHNKGLQPDHIDLT